MVRQYGLNVHGMDLSANMILIADDRLKREDAEVKNKVSFELPHITMVNYPYNEYDLVYSRDTILHITDKEWLYKRMLAWLKPSGTLFVSDYCRGDQDNSLEFKSYIKSRGYDGNDLRTVGALDYTHTFIIVLDNELRYF